MNIAWNAFELAVAILVSLCGAYILQQTALSPLKSIPGPFFARFSNLWQLVVYYQGKQAQVLRRLHDRHGPVVRIGPKHVSLNQPSLIKTVYSMTGDYVKSIRYAAADSRSPDGQNVPLQFSTRDEDHHTKMWRPIAKYYSPSHLLSFEPHVDDVIRKMERRLEQEFCFGNEAGKSCDIHQWLTFGIYPQAQFLILPLIVAPAAFEVIMVCNFTKIQGFLKERNKDMESLLADSVFASAAFMCLGNFPRIERLLRFLIRKPIFNNGELKFSLHQIAERRGLASECVHEPPDFLDNFLDSQKASPDTVDDNMILAYLTNSITAGGDTSGGTMSGVMYNTLKHPRVLKLLQQEFDLEVRQTPISWKVASTLPYLDAVIQESIRFHPGVSFTLERVVPKEGLVLPDGGGFIQPGTIVGMHPWIINRDHSIFGRDADFFVPERWLQKEGEDTATFSTRVSLMKNTVLSFGGGKRACIGKNLALMEIYKIMGTLFASFDFEFAEPGKEPEIIHSAYVRMKGFNVTVKPREKNVVP
ncbi:MAG: hypothetical protein Q9168_008194 [Polycauliona sp. 1 TL-2023]